MQASNPKVMHFVHWTRSGITSIVKTLCAKELHSFLLLYDDDDFENEYIEIKSAFELKANKNPVVSIIKFYKAIFYVRPDIIHCHSLTPLLITCIMTFRPSVVFHIHSEYPYFYSETMKARIKRLLLRLVVHCRNVKVLSVSVEAARRFTEITQVECNVLPNGLPNEGGHRKSFSCEKNRYRFYSVCRLSEEKNILLAIDIISALSENLPRSRIIYDIYGDGPEYSKIQEKLHSDKLAGIVNLKGWSRCPECLPSHYDFYLSTSNFEGFGLSILCALRGKNIVISTNVGELVKGLEDGISLFKIDFTKDDAVSKMMDIFLLSDRELSVIQENGRSVYLERYSFDRYLSRLKAIYRSF